MTTTPPPEGTTEPRSPCVPGCQMGPDHYGGLCCICGPGSATCKRSCPSYRPSPPVPAAEHVCTLHCERGRGHYPAPVPAAEDDAVERQRIIERAGDAIVEVARDYAADDAVRSQDFAYAKISEAVQQIAALDAAGVSALRAEVERLRGTVTYLRNTQAAYSGALARANEREEQARQQVADLRARIEALPGDEALFDRIMAVRFTDDDGNDVGGMASGHARIALVLASAALAEGGQAGERRCYCRHDYHDTDCPEGWPEDDRPTPVVPDSTGLRERVAEALWAHDHRTTMWAELDAATRHGGHAVVVAAEYRRRADAVLAVVGQGVTAEQEQRAIRAVESRTAAGCEVDVTGCPPRDDEWDCAVARSGEQEGSK